MSPCKRVVAIVGFGQFSDSETYPDFPNCHRLVKPFNFDNEFLLPVLVDFLCLGSKYERAWSQGQGPPYPRKKLGAMGNGISKARTSCISFMRNLGSGWW